MQDEHRPFTREELQAESGRSQSTAKANLSKKLTKYARRTDNGYVAENLDDVDEESFARTCSQISSNTDDPLRPRFEIHTETLITKSRDAALAAVQVFNNPTATFRTESYIVLMVIAYTSLFHAVFERDHIDYREYKQDGTVRMVGGEEALMDASAGFSKFGDLCGGKYTRLNLDAARHNLNWILKARHIIEHRGTQHVDELLGSECQSLLLNYEEILVTEFGAYHAINCSLCFPLLLSSRRSPKLLEAIRRRQGADYDLVKDRLISLRNELPDEIVGDPAFRFPIFLIPVIGRNRRTADKALEVLDTDGLSAEDLADVERLILAIKHKTSTLMINPSEYCRLWEMNVVDKLKAELGNQVVSGDSTIAITNALIRDVVTAHDVHQRSKMYYRSLPDARAQYGQAFVDWMLTEYKGDDQFFHKAREARRNSVKLTPPPLD